MATKSKGFVYRPVVTSTKNGKKHKRKASFYWCQHRDRHGKSVRHVMTLPNGTKITDKDVARSELTKIIKLRS